MDNGTSTRLSTTTLGTPHVYRIDWTASGFTFYVDGMLATTITRSVANNMVVIVSDFNTGGGSLSVDWVRVTPYVSPCTFASRVIDAGELVHWTDLSATGATPTGTSLNFETRRLSRQPDVPGLHGRRSIPRSPARMEDTFNTGRHRQQQIPPRLRWLS